MTRFAPALPRPAPSAVVSAVALAVLGLPVLPALVGQWLHDPNYSYGLFVPAMAAWLVRRRLDEWNAAPARPAAAGAWLVLAGAALHLAGVAAAEHYAARMGLVVMAAGLVLAHAGSDRGRTMLAPFVLLALAVPLPYVIYYRLTFPLQLLSSRVTAGLLSAAGMPVLRTGNVLHLEAYTLEVVTACSGLRSAMTLVAVAVWLGALVELRGGRRALLVAAAVPVALGVNVARLVLTATLSALAGPAAADGFLHGLSGVGVFLAGFALLAVLGRRLR